MSGYREAQPPGFEKTPDLRTWESEVPCPRCSAALYCAERDGIEVSGCGHCGGIWVTTEVAKRALATGSRVPEELARKVERVTRARPWVATAALVCGVCAAPMHRSKIGQVVVDSCVHGTWFDREELGAVMRHVRGEAPLHRGAEAAFMAEEEDRKKYGPFKEVVAFFRELVPAKLP